jgi:hypothetical protein
MLYNAMYYVILKNYIIIAGVAWNIVWVKMINPCLLIKVNSLLYITLFILVSAILALYLY